MKIRFILLFIITVISANLLCAQTFVVGGDADKFYPVSFYDQGWDQNKPTEMVIGRSSIHGDGNWKGSVMASFKYHSNNWGNLATFIDVNLFDPNYGLIAGWADGSNDNVSRRIWVWIRGGGLTYYASSTLDVGIQVYDGVQNALPFQEENGPLRTYKTEADSYVNKTGLNSSGTAFFTGAGYNYMNGNLGIGSANPLKKLEVWVPANDFISVGNAILPGQYAGIHFGYQEYNNYYRKSALVFERLDNAARGKIHLLNNGELSSASAGLADARLTINYDGKVGINNTNPEADLDVNGEVKWSGYAAGNSRALKIGYSGGNYGGIGYNIDFNRTTGLFNRPLNDRSSYLEFTVGGFRFYGTNNSTASNNVTLDGSGSNFNFLAILTNAGDMGLGTLTPKEKLSVNGKIRAHEVKVEINGWPDYVFEKNYRLQSLTDLEQFIKINKHLPDMPTAKKAENEGISLGEMNKQLLKKVEELTLFIIDQDKKLATEKMQNEKQEKLLTIILLELKALKKRK